jgi:hypothetical protein
VCLDAQRRTWRRTCLPERRTSRHDREPVLVELRRRDVALLEGVDVVVGVVAVVGAPVVGVVVVVDDVVVVLGGVVVVVVVVDAVDVVVLGSVAVVVEGAVEVVVVVGSVAVVVVALAAGVVVVGGGVVAVCDVVVSVPVELGEAASAVAGRSARTPGTDTASRTAVTTPAPGRRRHRRACWGKRCIA